MDLIAHVSFLTLVAVGSSVRKSLRGKYKRVKVDGAPQLEDVKSSHADGKMEER